MRVIRGTLSFMHVYNRKPVPPSRVNGRTLATRGNKTARRYEKSDFPREPRGNFTFLPGIKIEIVVDLSQPLVTHRKKNVFLRRRSLLRYSLRQTETLSRGDITRNFLCLLKIITQISRYLYILVEARRKRQRKTLSISSERQL